MKKYRKKISKQFHYTMYSDIRTFLAKTSIIDENKSKNVLDEHD
jgi:hypothetical protein